MIACALQLGSFDIDPAKQFRLGAEMLVLQSPEIIFVDPKPERLGFATDGKAQIAVAHQQRIGGPFLIMRPSRWLVGAVVILRDNRFDRAVRLDLVGEIDAVTDAGCVLGHQAQIHQARLGRVGHDDTRGRGLHEFLEFRLEHGGARKRLAGHSDRLNRLPRLEKTAAERPPRAHDHVGDHPALFGATGGDTGHPIPLRTQPNQRFGLAGSRPARHGDRIDFHPADACGLHQIEFAQDLLFGDAIAVPPPPDKGTCLGWRIQEFLVQRVVGGGCRGP